MSLLRGTSTVSVLTIISRILGFLRDLLTAQIFGAGFIADAFFVAQRIPNLLRSFVAEGAFTSAFVPVISREVVRGPSAGREALRSISAFLLTATALLTVVGMCFAEEIIDFFAPGFRRTPELFDMSTLLLRIMMPFVMCISLVAAANAALNSVKVFGAAAWSQVWMNVVLIIGAALALFFKPEHAAQILAVSFVVGGIVQVLVQVPALARAGFTFMPNCHLFSAATRRVLQLMLPALIGATMYQLSIFFNTVFASLLTTGSVSWLYYADRLVQLPLGIFSIALASVLLPTLARADAEHDAKSFAANLEDALRYTSFIIIPISAALILCAEPLIYVMFERGAFTSESTRATALAVQAYALGLWSISCHSMVARAFIAKNDTVTPTLIGALSLLVSLLVSLLIMGKVDVPDYASPHHASTLAVWTAQAQEFLGVTDGSLHLGHVGLALASSSASLVAFLAAIVLVDRTVAFRWMPFLTASLKTMLACVGALLPSWACIEYLSAAFGFSISQPANLAALASFVTAAVLWIVFFVLLGSLLKLRELGESRELLTRWRSTKRIS